MSKVTRRWVEGPHTQPEEGPPGGRGREGLPLLPLLVLCCRTINADG